MKLSLFSASALLVAVASGCSSSSTSDAPGPLAFNSDPDSNAASEVYLEGRTEGDRVIVDVMAKGVKDVHGTAIRVKWDPDALSLVEATPSNLWSKQAVLLSKEALPEPTMMPALMAVSGMPPWARISATFLREARCLESFFSLVMPPR